MKTLYLLLLLVCTLGFSAVASAQTPNCETMSPKARTVAQQVMDTAYPYACCDQTISTCLKADAPCTLAVRLANETCRLASLGKSADDIKRILDQRAMTMSELTPAVPIEVRPEHLWGNPNSKIILSIYLCGRCPYCSKHVPTLIHKLEQSPLKDKIAVNLRLFPIKSHTNSTPAALGIEAAAQLGHAWPYLILSYENFDRYDPSIMKKWAEELGMNAEEFENLTKDRAVRDIVAKSKKEGLQNSVESTPTFFLNGRRIQGSFDAQLILSMLEEAVENEEATTPQAHPAP